MLCASDKLSSLYSLDKSTALDSLPRKKLNHWKTERKRRKFQKRILCPQLCIVTNPAPPLQCVYTFYNSYIYIWSLDNALVFKLQALLFLVLWRNCRGAEIMNSGWSCCIGFCIKYCSSVIPFHFSHLSLFIGTYLTALSVFLFCYNNSCLCLRLKQVHEQKLNSDIFLWGSHSFNPSVTLLTH